MLQLRKPTLLLVLLLSASLNAEQADNCKLQTVTANVLQQDGTPAKDLTKDSFKATYKNHSSRVVLTTHTNAPRRIVVLLDVSASMGAGLYQEDPNKWKIARTVASELITSAPPHAQVSLSVFASKIEKTFDFSTARQIIVDWLNANQDRPKVVKAHTALNQTIMAALKQLDPPQPGDAICAITDGGENASQITTKNVKDALRFSGTRLFSFMLDDFIATMEETRGTQDLSDLTKDSGGSTFTVRPNHLAQPILVTTRSRMRYQYDNDMIAAIKVSAKLLHAQVSDLYTISLELPEELHKPKNWKLEIVDNRGIIRKDVEVHYPHQLNECVVQSAKSKVP